MTKRSVSKKFEQVEIDLPGRTLHLSVNYGGKRFPKYRSPLPADSHARAASLAQPEGFLLSLTFLSGLCRGNLSARSTCQAQLFNPAATVVINCHALLLPSLTSSGEIRLWQVKVFHSISKNKKIQIIYSITRETVTAGWSQISNFVQKLHRWGILSSRMDTGMPWHASQEQQACPILKHWAKFTSVNVASCEWHNFNHCYSDHYRYHRLGCY